MYDDIAHSENNPTPGVIINKPDGNDVYKGVPKVCVFISKLGNPSISQFDIIFFSCLYYRITQETMPIQKICMLLFLEIRLL